jgi:hypothetical protein
MALRVVRQLHFVHRTEFETETTEQHFWDRIGPSPGVTVCLMEGVLVTLVNGQSEDCKLSEMARTCCL